MFRATAFAFAVLVSGIAAEAHATAIELTGDTRQGFGGRIIQGQYIGKGGQVRLTPQGSVDDATKVDGKIALDFDFRHQRGHVGLASSQGSNNGRFTLTNGDKSISFGSHDLDGKGVFTTDAFNGALAGGEWLLRLDNPNGGDPWASFKVSGSATGAAGGGGGGNGGGGDGGGGNGGGGNGGGQVPAPGPLGLIAAMALFGLWRRKRAAV